MQSDVTWQIGSPISVKPTTFTDGSSEAGGAVHVCCRVDARGSVFDVQLSAALEGASSMSGSMLVTGSIDPNASMSTGLSATFGTMGQSFSSTTCTFTQTYNNAPLPSGGKPAQGRIWGHLDCPLATVGGMFGAGADGGPVPRTCETSADFLFENCQ
jgi:hypothetical protein